MHDRINRRWGRDPAPSNKICQCGKRVMNSGLCRVCGDKTKLLTQLNKEINVFIQA